MLSPFGYFTSLHMRCVIFQEPSARRRTTFRRAQRPRPHAPDNLSRRQLRIASPSRANAAAGAQIHNSSDFRTATPRTEKNEATPMGDTRMGRQGRWKRAFENGLKNAIPLPPLVIASRIPCDAAAANTTPNARPRGTAHRDRMAAAARATSRAKKSEWVKPRWPSGESYGIPAQYPAASTSGRTLATQAAIASLGGMTRVPAATVRASGTAGCERTEGNGRKDYWRANSNVLTT